MAYTTIDDPGEYFNTLTFTGTDSSGTRTGVGFTPDMFWHKNRGNTQSHGIIDVIRGNGNYIVPNANSAQNNDVGAYGIAADGYTFPNGDSFFNSGEMVYWNWKKTADAGFDIVAFTGNGSARTISHSLSAVPKMYIVKNRSTGSTQWRVYHASLGATKHMALDATQAIGDAASVFNDTEPTSSVFSVGTDDAANKNGDSLIAYLFADKQGYSKFGSYIGNGNVDGTFVYTGFKPAFIMTKQTDGTDWWVINDNKRDPFNASTYGLRPNDSAAESSDEAWTKDLLSNGFKHRTANSGSNGSGNEYIYMAFAENPFVTSTGVPATAR